MKIIFKQRYQHNASSTLQFVVPAATDAKVQCKHNMNKLESKTPCMYQISKQTSRYKHLLVSITAN